MDLTVNPHPNPKGHPMSNAPDEREETEDEYRAREAWHDQESSRMNIHHKLAELADLLDEMRATFTAGHPSGGKIQTACLSRFLAKFNPAVCAELVVCAGILVRLSREELSEDEQTTKALADLDASLSPNKKATP